MAKTPSLNTSVRVLSLGLVGDVSIAMAAE